MMKTIARGSLLGAIFLLLIPSIASATSVNLVWNGTAVNTSGAIASMTANSVTLNPSGVATLTLDVVLDVDSRGVSGAFLTLDFDTDFDNELNAVSWKELAWSQGMMSLSALTPGINPCGRGGCGTFVPSTTESTTNGEVGSLFTFEGATLGNGPSSTTLTFARIVFTTNHGLVNSNDPGDIFSSGLIGGNGDGVTIFDANFGVANVNIVPEPGTVILLGLGVGSLALAGRGRGRK